jgi:hypothetical protein
VSVDPAKVCLFQPGELKKFKADLFERIGDKIRQQGGSVCKGDAEALRRLPEEIIPIVGCSPYLKGMIDEWRKTGRRFIYWDRGYARRVFATSLPTGSDGGYYRWHLNGFQMQKVRDVPDDRWKALSIGSQSWAKGGRHIVIAAPSRTYARFHGIEGWIADTIDVLARVTDRQLVIRDKEHVRNRPLTRDLEGALCLVTHGSIAAVESVVLGCPVFVHPDSACALVGKTDLKEIESPVYPDRQAWLNSLAYCQFSERELVDGTLWRLLE